MNRSTLLSRLKPEFAEGFTGASNDNFRDAVGKIEQLLNSRVFYSDLTISEISRIWLFSDVEGHCDRSSLSYRFGEDMFHPEKGCV